MVNKLLLASFFLGSFSFAQSLLTPEKMMDFKRISGGDISPDGRYLLYSQTKIDVKENKGNADLFVIDLQTNTTKQLTDTPYSEFEAQWAGKNMIYFLSTESGQVDLWKMNLDGNKTKVSTIADIEGFKIAADESKVIILKSIKTRENLNEVYADLPKANARVENDLMYRHWASWDNYTVEHLFIHYFKDGQVEPIGKDLLDGEAFHGSLPPFGGLGNVTFSNDTKSIIYATKKLKGKAFATSTNSELYQYDIETAKTTCLTCDLNFKGYDLQPAFSSKGDLAWLSMERNGFEADKSELIIKNQKGEIKNLTKKYDFTIASFAWHPDGTKIFCLVPTKGTQQIFQLDLSSGEFKQITSGHFDYLTLSPFGNKIYAARQSITSPTELFEIIITQKKGVISANTKQLTQANQEILNSLSIPKVEEKWVKTSDGKDMLVWMV